MTKRIIYLVLLVFIVIPLNADKYAGEIFRLGAGVRNYALGNTGVSDANSSYLAYWNPSLLAKDNNYGLNFELMHSEEFMGAVTYDSFAANWTNYALVFSRIGVNDIPLTRLTNPSDTLSVNNQPEKYKTVNNADYLLYFGFYQKVSNYVVGFSPKLVYRHLAETSGYGFGADISSHFDLHENIMLGLNLRDFFTTQIFWENSTHEIVNPSLDAEVKWSFLVPILKTRAVLYTGTEIHFENRKEAATHSFGRLSLDYHFGLEIPLPNYLSFYGGYDIDAFTTGLSLNISHFILNYAFKYNTELDNTHRVSLAFRI